MVFEFDDHTLLSGRVMQVWWIASGKQFFTGRMCHNTRHLESGLEGE
jgi:hypothetical protein